MSKIAGLAAVGASIAAIATQPAVRSFVAKWAGLQAPGGAWRAVAIVLALANLKNLPFVWHLRFLRAFLYQLYIQPTPMPPHALFQPIVTSTRTPLMETDYNLHKSNSTYFSDMDISRTHLFTALIRDGIRKDSRLYGKKKSEELAGAEGVGGPRGKHIVALGGVSCLFKREIPPYAKFEMWTRVLAWDQKWFYLVTHLVKPGVAPKPPKYTLQPWKRGGKAVEEADREELQQKLKGAVFASALAKYVIKRGRITVPPEQALFRADMLPTKPEGWVYKGDINGKIDGDVHSVLPGAIAAAEEWNWDTIEAERLRGLRIAQKFTEMDALHDEFTGGVNGILGEYADLF